MLLGKWIGTTPDEKTKFRMDVDFEIRRRGLNSRVTADQVVKLAEQKVRVHPDAVFPGWAGFMATFQPASDT